MKNLGAISIDRNADKKITNISLFTKYGITANLNNRKAHTKDIKLKTKALFFGFMLII
ncbi:hypothetical protein Y10_12940 [Neptunitalea sp. Y10]|uniref:Uncharacterized protein n=1 Tax=Neptunitalea lumnitzerae TaxID=2965509 RepID=A0ABQ5MHZ1_9FLAO|nr:hypothetical protein Y10_12940 [Neptunitalea sp. Y10]